GGAGSINVLDTGGGLNVTLARTVNGNINLTAAGAGGNLALTQVSAPLGTVTLTANGAVTGTPGGPADVTAAAPLPANATGVGTAATPLETALGTVAANVSGGVFLNNTGTLAVGAVGAINGIAAPGAAVRLASNNVIIVRQVNAGSLAVLGTAGDDSLRV